MTSTRAITAGELTKLRSDTQWSKLYVAIRNPEAVFACRINQTFSSLDGVTYLTYDGVTTGAYTDVEVGMTMYVGSSAGAYDLGMVRIRKAPTSSILYIGITSKIVFADDVYLTVVNDFELWARHWRTIDENVVYMDYDLEYDDENENHNPIVVIGPDRVLWIDDTDVTIHPTAADSWVPESSISSYLWTAEGSSSSSGLTTDTPTITYDTPGQYIITCTVTASNGKSSIGRRIVFVFDDENPAVSAQISSYSCDYESGGWTYGLIVSENALTTDIRERTKVIIFSRDTYGNTPGSLGPIDECEDIICVGYTSEEAIIQSPEFDTVRFNVYTANKWMQLTSTYGCGLVQVYSAPTDWKFAENVTVDKAIHNLIFWRSTIASIIDVYVTGDTRTNAGIVAQTGPLWEQLTYMTDKILAKPVFNRFGQLFIQIDQQLLADADRSGIPIVMDITEVDWRGEDTIQIQRIPTSNVSMITLSGTGDTEEEQYFSRAPGTVFDRFGRIEARDNLMIADQTQANILSGMAFAKAANEYEIIRIPFSFNNRFVDIAPWQYLRLSLTVSDTIRGIVWTNKKLIPRRIDSVYDNGSIVTDVECEVETSGLPGVTVIPPKLPGVNIISGGYNTINPFGGGEFPKLTWPPPTHPPPIFIPPPVTECIGTEPPNGPYNMFFSGTYTEEGGADGWEATQDFPCIMRAATSDNPTRYTLRGTFYKKFGGVYTETLDDDFYDVVAQPPAGSGFSEITAYHDTVTGDGRTRTGYFDAPEGFECARIILRIRVGAGSFPGQTFIDNAHAYDADWGGDAPWDNPTFTLVNSNLVRFTGVFNKTYTQGGPWGGWAGVRVAQNMFYIRPYGSIMTVYGTCVIATAGTATATGSWYQSACPPYYPLCSYTRTVAAGALPNRAVNDSHTWDSSDFTGSGFWVLEAYWNGTDKATHWYFDLFFTGELVSSRIDVNSLYISNVCPVE